MEVRRLLIVTRLYHQLILDAEVLRLSQEKEPIQTEVGDATKQAAERVFERFWIPSYFLFLFHRYFTLILSKVWFNLGFRLKFWPGEKKKII